jgi:hypothetical protein
VVGSFLVGTDILVDIVAVVPCIQEASIQASIQAFVQASAEDNPMGDIVNIRLELDIVDKLAVPVLAFVQVADRLVKDNHSLVPDQALPMDRLVEDNLMGIASVVRVVD